MPEKPGFLPEEPEQPEQQQESKGELFEGIVFTKSGDHRAKYRSSAPHRKIMFLSEDSPKPQPGTEYKVRVVEDTNPENPMAGKLIVEIVIDPEGQKRYAIQLAEEARQALAGNDFDAVLKKLKTIKEQVDTQGNGRGEGEEEWDDGADSFAAALDQFELEQTFGENVIGVEEIEKFRGKKFSEKEKTRIYQMWSDKVREENLTGKDLERLGKEGFMVILRSGTIEFDGKEVPATINNLKRKFGALFNDQIWYSDEEFVKDDAVGLSWAIVKKESIEESRGKGFAAQEEVLKEWAKMHKVDPKFVKRRTAAEVAYDVLVWSLNKGEDILEDDWERTSTRAKSGDYVCLNSPRSVGLTLRDISSFLEASSLGVCPAL